MKTMMLSHVFWSNIDKPSSIFDGVNTMRGLTKNIIDFAEKNGIDQDMTNTIKGDAFEAFGELYIKLLGTISVKVPGERNRRDLISLLDYSPIFGQEYGVDGVGKNKDGNTVTFQFKFRSREASTLCDKKDHVANIIKESTIVHAVPADADDRMVLFTNCKGMAHGTEMGACYGKISTINGAMLKKELDNAALFWDKCKELSQLADNTP